MALASLFFGSAFSQPITVKAPSEFTLKGDYYVDVNVPMNSLEQVLFLEVVNYLDYLTKRPPNSVAYRPAVAGASLLSVKISKESTILLNFTRSVLSKESGGWNAQVEDFMNLVANGVTYIANQKQLEVGGILFAVEGKNFETYMPKLDKYVPQGLPAPLAVPNRVVVSAGHGIYYDHGVRALDNAARTQVSRPRRLYDSGAKRPACRNSARSQQRRDTSRARIHKQFQNTFTFG